MKRATGREEGRVRLRTPVKRVAYPKKKEKRGLTCRARWKEKMLMAKRGRKHLKSLRDILGGELWKAVENSGRKPAFHD